MSITEYERKRLANISNNNEILQSLGLKNGNDLKTKVKRKKSKTPISEVKVAKRSSMRVRGENVREIADFSQDTKSKIKKEFNLIEPVQYLDLDRHIIECPFVLFACPTTIWSFGTYEVSPAFQSSNQCLYKHPYPIGYTASTYWFDREWIMWISKGSLGPIFNVMGANGKIESGPTPTKPWTDICIKLSNKVGKTRLSGPLMFGFSEPIVVEALQRMKNKEERAQNRYARSLKSRKRGYVLKMANCSFAVNQPQFPCPPALTQFLDMKSESNKC